MITKLRVAKSAYFFRKLQRIPKQAVAKLFTDLRSDHENPSKAIFRHVKEKHGKATFSAIAFYYDRDPSFLDLPAGHERERICGYLLLVEYKDVVALFRSGLEVTPDFKTEYLGKLGTD